MSKSKRYIKTSFAGANTGKGFFSFYDSLFPEEKLDGLYIIKGGSGTGKSTFMKRLSDITAKKGHTPEHYLCGSDATSLDGIIIKGKRGTKVGVIDGTPPHPREFRSPGAAGDILNFGMFWNSSALRGMRREVDSLVREKQAYFDTAYRYLGAAGKIDSHIKDIWNKAYLRQKGAAAAERLVNQIGLSGTILYRQLTGYTMSGEVALRPSGMTREFVLAGDKDAAKRFLSDVENVLISKGVGAEISLSPLDMKSIDSIYFPESSVWLHIGNEDDTDPEKVINMRRFVDRETAAEYRQRLRFGRKCRESLLSGAMESLAGARVKHFALEELYGQHMNFEALASQSSLWYSEIMSRLD